MQKQFSKQHEEMYVE